MRAFHLFQDTAGNGADRDRSGLLPLGDDLAAATFAVHAQAPVPVHANIDGTDGSETIDGTAGDDVINGFGGDDTLNGLGGNDWLDGGSGTDRLVGGTGNDVYITDSVQDVVVEASGEGFDTVYAINNYVLPANAAVEVLAYYDILSPNVINLIGNGFDNTIYGDAGANGLRGNGGNDIIFGMGGGDQLIGDDGDDYLDGGEGNNTLIGGKGDDIYIAHAGDNIQENPGEGVDRVYVSTDFSLGLNQSLEVLSSRDSLATWNLHLIGNQSANALYGDAGDDYLDGGRGNDYYLGLGGADTFAFTAGLGVDIDEIGDFTPGSDKILLDSSIYGDLFSDTVETRFEVSSTGATRPDSRLIYDPATGSLTYDFDGNGPCVPLNVALLDSEPSLRATDLIATVSSAQAPVAVADAITLAPGTLNADFHLLDNDTSPTSRPPELVGVGGEKFVLLPEGLSTWSVITHFGIAFISRGSGPGGIGYTVNTSDTDYKALAPGATATDTFFYEITNGTAVSTGKISVTFTKPGASGIDAPADIAAPAPEKGGAIDLSAFGDDTSDGSWGVAGHVSSHLVRLDDHAASIALA